MAYQLPADLKAAIDAARGRVYEVGSPTPLQRLTLPQYECEIWIKREDLSPINAYKWRGAYNCIAAREIGNADTEIVAASAGNHAQGVALAVRNLGLKARIFMPLATPQMKQNAVARHGGDAVAIELVGDTYNEAADAARRYTESNNSLYIHPFDDTDTIAGQATIAEEILDQRQPFDHVFLQIGGGGMAAGVSAWLKAHWPHIAAHGVEGVDQASMKAAIAAGKPVTLDHVDTFCDGTAVTRAGDVTFNICKDTLDDVLTVSNEEVCAAIQTCWDTLRVIPEPSGAMGLAGLMQYIAANKDAVKGQRLLAIVCGANMDFGKLGLIASQSAVGAHRRRYLRFTLDEQRGSLLGLLDALLSDINVTEFQYGKIDHNVAYPVVAFEATPERLSQLDADLKARHVPYEDVTGAADIRYRIIPYRPELFSHPLFFHIHFPERKGALRDLMRKISGVANLCYFNYAYSGETIGRAIMGFEFKDKAGHSQIEAILADTLVEYRPVDGETSLRLLGSVPPAKAA
jgi:threonine dehydratase